MQDATQLPIFPKAVVPSGQRRPSRRTPTSQLNRTSSLGDGIRRLCIGVLAGLVVVSVLWYLMQYRQISSAAPLAAQTDQAPQGVVLVTVTTGDTLWDLSSRHRPNGVDQREWVNQVAAYNDIRPDALFAGQILAIPTY